MLTRQSEIQAGLLENLRDDLEKTRAELKASKEEISDLIEHCSEMACNAAVVRDQDRLAIEKEWTIRIAHLEEEHQQQLNDLYADRSHLTNFAGDLSEELEELKFEMTKLRGPSFELVRSRWDDSDEEEKPTEDGKKLFRKFCFGVANFWKGKQMVLNASPFQNKRP